MASFTRTKKVSVSNPERRARPKAKAKKNTAAHGHRKPMSAAARASFAKRMAAARAKKERNPSMATKKSSTKKSGSKKKKNPFKAQRRRNGSGVSSMEKFGTQAGIALVALVGTRQIPQMILGENNSGLYGYAANLVTTLVLAYGANRAAGPQAGQAALIGGGLYLVQRVLTEKVSPIGQYLSLTGLGDAAAATSLGTIADGYFVHPTIMDRNGNPVIPQQIINAANAARPQLPAGPASMAGTRMGGGRMPDRFARRF